MALIITPSTKYFIPTIEQGTEHAPFVLADTLSGFWYSWLPVFAEQVDAEAFGTSLNLLGMSKTVIPVQDTLGTIVKEARTNEVKYLALHRPTKDPFYIVLDDKFNMEQISGPRHVAQYMRIMNRVGTACEPNADARVQIIEALGGEEQAHDTMPFLLSFPPYTDRNRALFYQQHVGLSFSPGLAQA